MPFKLTDRNFCLKLPFFVPCFLHFIKLIPINCSQSPPLLISLRYLLPSCPNCCLCAVCARRTLEGRTTALWHLHTVSLQTHPRELVSFHVKSFAVGSDSRFPSFLGVTRCCVTHRAHNGFWLCARNGRALQPPGLTRGC